MYILVATDGSTESQEAVRFGAMLAQRLAGTLTLLHAVLPSQERGEGEAVLRSAQASAAECGVQGTTRLEVVTWSRPSSE
jgi:nucleotide-binding universal stress UspA family protein